MIELHMYYSDNIFAQLDTDYVYTPYGLVRTAGAITQPIQWSSEFADPETALIYYNYRYYNPLDGRWTRRDPIGIEGGVNLYTYLSNYPVHHIDILGNAPDYKPEEWNNPRYQYTNNCYSYACDLKIDGKDIPDMIFKLQPGQLSGTYEPVPAGGFTCELIMSRAQADGLYVTSAEKDCQCKYHKVALIVGPNDYHWYRLDSNGYWSHKPGSYPVTNVDANGDLINNPETAKWSNIYTKFWAHRLKLWNGNHNRREKSAEKERK